MIQNIERDRPTNHSLIYLTHVASHKITKEPQYKDDFVVQLLNESYGSHVADNIKGYTRSYYTLKGHYTNLWLYGRPITDKPQDTLIDVAIKLASQAFRLPNPVEPYDWNHLSKVPFIPSSGAGYGYIGKNGDPGNHTTAITRAVANLVHWSDLTNGKSLPPFRYTPDLAWTRTQLVTFTSPKIRNVWGKTFHNIIIEGITAAPIIEAYKVTSCPMVFGICLFKELPNYIHSSVGSADDQKISVGIDYTKFDSSLQPWLLRAAFKIVRENINFTQQQQIDSFNYTIEYFINTPVVMPDGRMWLTKVGLPSGSY